MGPASFQESAGRKHICKLLYEVVFNLKINKSLLNLAADKNKTAQAACMVINATYSPADER